ncbi:hypothetical protein J3R74_002875 [Puniceicoccus vermicola]
MQEVGEQRAGFSKILRMLHFGRKRLAAGLFGLFCPAFLGVISIASSIEFELREQ